jgi:hypothetical protein
MNWNGRQGKIFGTLGGIFLISFFTNIQLVLVPNIGGENLLYSEYLDISLYLFDICFALLLLFIILYNKYVYLSIIKMKLFHVEHEFRMFVLLPLLVLLLIIMSIAYSDYSLLSLRQAIFFVEGVSLYYLILFFILFHVKHNLSASLNVSRETIGLTLKSLMYCLALFGLFNCFLAIIQFCTGSSVGLNVLGESNLVLGGSDVASVTLFGVKYLRAYGLFLHPNILAFFLTILVILLLAVNRVDVSRETQLKEYFHVKQIIVVILFIGLLLTFSKIVLVCLIISLYLWYTQIKMNNVSRETKSLNVFHVKHVLFSILMVLVVFFVLQSKSYLEREVGLLLYVESLTASSLGSGAGTIFTSIPKRFSSISSPWLLQPVHNVFLIYYYEIGVAGLFLVVYFVLGFFKPPIQKRMFHGKQYESFLISVCLVGLVCTVSMSDHYLVTIPQGIFLFWATLGVAAGLRALYIDKNTI